MGDNQAGSEEDRMKFSYKQSLTRKNIVIAVLVAAVALFVYFEMAHMACAEQARLFLVKNSRYTHTASDSNTAYNLAYKICMRGKGL